MVDSRVIDPFDASRSWSVEALRGPEGLRRWSNDDVVPRPGDVFQERLYCIRWVNAKGERRYAAPDDADLAREAKVLELLRERFADWQREGFIPSKAMPKMATKTDEPIRTRGWTHWHHLFTPRQLLDAWLLAEIAEQDLDTKAADAVAMLDTRPIANWNSRLCRWLQPQGGGIGRRHTRHFTTKPQSPLQLFRYVHYPIFSKSRYSYGRIIVINESTEFKAVVTLETFDETCDFWITDPPYADAVNYHELGDFFLAWYDKQLAKAFPNGYPMPGPNSRSAGMAKTSAVPWSRSTRTSLGTCRTTACRW